MPKPHAHGIAIHDGIDRILVTSTVRASDLGDAGDTITVLRASTGEVLGTHRVSNKTEPGGEALVEIVFVPQSDLPVAYITNMYGNSLWTATGNRKNQNFDVTETFDFSGHDVAVPLEIYFTEDGKTLYVTTAKPGHLHVFDISADPAKPVLHRRGAPTTSLSTITMAWVKNSLLNLPGMSDGSITIVDLQKGEAIGSVDALKEQGFNPNSIVLLPQWNHPAEHWACRGRSAPWSGSRRAPWLPRGALCGGMGGGPASEAPAPWLSVAGRSSSPASA